MMAGVVRPLASLSSGLLARKGQARPAMRPQGHAGPPGTGLEDLGWNDLGAPAPVADLPPVLVQREELKGQVETPAPVPDPVPADPVPADPVPAAAVARIGREAAAKGRAAFTLRLDPARHLRLRLAAAATHRSAQAVVTAALDAYLSTVPEVEELARQCAAAAPFPSDAQEG